MDRFSRLWLLRLPLVLNPRNQRRLLKLLPGNSRTTYAIIKQLLPVIIHIRFESVLPFFGRKWAGATEARRRGAAVLHAPLRKPKHFWDHWGKRVPGVLSRWRYFVCWWGIFEPIMHIDAYDGQCFLESHKQNKVLHFSGERWSMEGVYVPFVEL